jgi:hypothetical protein
LHIILSAVPELLPLFVIGSSQNERADFNELRSESRTHLSSQ